MAIKAINAVHEIFERREDAVINGAGEPDPTAFTGLVLTDPAPKSIADMTLDDYRVGARKVIDGDHSGMLV